MYIRNVSGSRCVTTVSENSLTAVREYIKNSSIHPRPCEVFYGRGTLLNLVESYIKIKRKDYLKVCEMLEKINSDLNMYETEDNVELIAATRRKVAIAQNVLIEEE